MPSQDPNTISVVISTFERPESCERALTSVLDQSHTPLEVLVCDDGSRDDTADRLRAWESRSELVRYLRTASNSGTPATTRNLGIAHAKGEWVAFLDDDDTWLPQKLALQRAFIDAESVDVVATNALRSDGGLYFADALPVAEPTRQDLLNANPIVTSSVLVRRSLARFPTALWMRGIEDYAAWLDLSDAGARFVILGEPLIHYRDAGAGRLSAARSRRQLALARLAWRRAAKRPFELARIRAALNNTIGAVRVVMGSETSRLRALLDRRGRGS
jgi:glycosyltransferase involved in cell wall biosynthesis